ncbi:MAG: DUF262 domain-containing protein [Candidatus Brocadiales bacterium]|nr:DUF262 domain-containing protein [Candidatus Bathyanammoxibius sp.]
MKNFDTRTYSVNDFREWDEQGQLILSPKFQRRSVWTDKARSYFIDTIIRGKPIPKIFIRQEINPRTRHTKREVVDGQQRLHTILNFLKDAFKVSKVHNEEFGGKFFSEFPPRVQNGILKYELSVDLLLDANNAEVLDIFSRLNSYSVTLNAQELRNAKYAGDFKHTVYKLALDYLTFWTDNNIFSDAQILRMTEAELTSELLIAMSDGIRAKKRIESYYKNFETRFPKRDTLSRRFRITMDTIGGMMGGTLGSSSFSRRHMFYTLFCSVYHMLYKLPEMRCARIRIKPSDYAKIRLALEQVDNIFEKPDESLLPKERKFLESARRATTDAPVRKFRTAYVCEVMVKSLKK